MSKKKLVTLEAFKKYHENLMKYINKHDDLVLNGETTCSECDETVAENKDEDCEEKNEADNKSVKINNMFCEHENNDVICWHWTHGWNGNDPLFLEIQLKCKDCGKYHFIEMRDKDECDKFVLEHKDKKWSDTCKPVL